MNGMRQAPTVRAGALSALVAAVLLVGMALVGAPAGDALSALAGPAAPDPFDEQLRLAVPVLLRVLAIDNLFLIAYTGAFVGAAALVWPWAPAFAAPGFAFAALTALLDLAENALAVHVLRAIQASLPVPASQAAWLAVLGQVKYAGAGLALVFFALALLIARPVSRALTLGAAAAFMLFPVVNTFAVIDPANSLALAGWMLVSLLASAGLLWRASSPGGEA
jgi:hypothetical protein